MLQIKFNKIFTNIGFHHAPILTLERGDDFMARYQATHSNEIIIEFTAMGSIMRVSAMDPQSLTEVVIQGPISTHRNNLADLARQKLSFVLAKKTQAPRR